VNKLSDGRGPAPGEVIIKASRTGARGLSGTGLILEVPFILRSGARRPQKRLPCSNWSQRGEAACSLIRRAGSVNADWLALVVALSLTGCRAESSPLQPSPEPPATPPSPGRQVLDLRPVQGSLTLLLRDTVRIRGSGFVPGMKVHFQTQIVSLSGHEGMLLEVTDTLLSVLPPLPQRRSTVLVWVIWPRERSGHDATIDSLHAPATFSFVGPDPSDARVYDYAFDVFNRYRNIHWRLDDPELTVWFDSVFPGAYREQIMRGFGRWEGILWPGTPRFRETTSPDDANFHIVSKFGLSASPRVDDDATRLHRVVIDMPISLSDPAPPENYLQPAVHEMGHGLGLWAHSPYLGDVMSTFGAESLPSERDVATLRHLYGQPPDLTN
jgi:hypothetical protein